MQTAELSHSGTMRKTEKSTPTGDPEGDDFAWPPASDGSEILWLDQRGKSDVGRKAENTPSTSSLVTVRTLLGAGAEIEWHDAVAIVQQLADDFAVEGTRPPGGGIRNLNAVVLQPNGRLQASIDRTAREPLVISLAKLLKMLMGNRPAPTNLRILVQTASAGPSSLSLAEWTSELARWERPGRSDKLIALYERTRNLPVAPQKPVMKAPRSAALPIQTTPRLQPSAAILGMASVGYIVSAAVVMLLLMNKSSISSQPSEVAPPRTAFDDRPSIAAPPPGDQSATQARSAVPDAARATDPRLFKHGDDGVQEPVLLKQYLPPRPRKNATESQVAMLEVVVDTRGLVESVRLTSPGNRYQDKWWLFTAKGWRFQPATKDGKPVRFLKRFSISDLNSSDPQ